MKEIKLRDIRFAKTDDAKGNRPTDIIISTSYKLEDLAGICILIPSSKNRGYVFLSELYYLTSEDLHYFDLKRIRDWNEIKIITFKFFYRSGTENWLRLEEDKFLTISLDEDGPRILEEKN